jgi:YVTN family beta-propeller protein
MSGSSLKDRLTVVAALLCLLSLATIPANAQTVVATIPAGTPSDAAVNPLTALAYVPSGHQVDVISEKTNTIVGSIPVAGTANALQEDAIDPVTNKLYVGDSQLLYVIDTRTKKVTATVNVPAVGIGVNIATNKIYVSDFNSNVYVIDGRTNNILKDIALPTGVENLAVNPVTNRIYVATEANFFGHVVVIDGSTDTVLTTVQDGGELSFNVGVDAIHNIVYVSDEFGTLSVINGATNTLTTTIALGGEPFGLAVDPVHRRVYVNNPSLNAVQVVDGTTNSLINTVPAGTSLEYSDIDFLRGLLYVQNQDGNVVVISTKS